MSIIATAGFLGSALAFALAAPSGPVLALAAFFAGGTLGGLVGAAFVAAFAPRRASA